VPNDREPPIEFASAAGDLERFADDHFERFTAAEQTRAERYAELAQVEIDTNGLMWTHEQREELAAFRLADKMRSAGNPHGPCEGRLDPKAALDYLQRKRFSSAPTDPKAARAWLAERRWPPGYIEGWRALEDVRRRKFWWSK
jgi:hypothetical protein